MKPSLYTLDYAGRPEATEGGLARPQQPADFHRRSGNHRGAFTFCPCGMSHIDRSRLGLTTAEYDVQKSTERHAVAGVKLAQRRESQQPHGQSFHLYHSNPAILDAHSKTVTRERCVNSPCRGWFRLPGGKGTIEVPEGCANLEAHSLAGMSARQRESL